MLSRFSQQPVHSQQIKAFPPPVLRTQVYFRWPPSSPAPSWWKVSPEEQSITLNKSNIWTKIIPLLRFGSLTELIQHVDMWQLKLKLWTEQWRLMKHIWTSANMIVSATLAVVKANKESIGLTWSTSLLKSRCAAKISHSWHLKCHVLFHQIQTIRQIHSIAL